MASQFACTECGREPTVMDTFPVARDGEPITCGIRCRAAYFRRQEFGTADPTTLVLEIDLAEGQKIPGPGYAIEKVRQVLILLGFKYTRTRISYK